MTFLVVDRIHRLEQLEGEDTDDLLRVIQASFGIEFTSDDLVRAETIGELGACIWGKLRHPASEQCLSAVVFYRLRRAFIGLFDTSRPLIKPDKPLLELMPWLDRRKQWRGIQKHSGLKLPDLRMPVWLFGLSLMTCIAFPALVAHRWSISGIGLVAVGLMTLVLVLYLLSPFARALPRSCDTFGDLVQLTLARNYATIASQHGGASEREILQALRQLIAAEISIDVDKIAPATRFPEGLKIH